MDKDNQCELLWKWLLFLQQSTIDTIEYYREKQTEERDKEREKDKGGDRIRKGKKRERMAMWLIEGEERKGENKREKER